jgi:hypothetical protein
MDFVTQTLMMGAANLRRQWVLDSFGGNPQNGLTNDEQFGYSVDCDNTLWTVGAPGYDSGRGQVRVFQILSGSATQIGNALDGENIGDDFGWSVAISGSYFAVGAPGYDNGRGKVYLYNIDSQSNITLVHEFIGENIGDGCGWSVALDYLYDVTVVIGEPYYDNNRGRVRGFAYSSFYETWVQSGSAIVGGFSERFGWSVSLFRESQSSLLLAIGAPYSSNNGLSENGRVTVYQRYSGASSSWAPIFPSYPDIYGSENYGRLGWSVSLIVVSSLRLAIGQPFTGPSATGSVLLYGWGINPIVLTGNAPYDNFGWSVVLRADPVVNPSVFGLAIGAPGDYTSSNSAGYVRSYQRKLVSGAQWEQAGLDIEGEALGDRLGNSVTFVNSVNGLIIGAPNRNNGRGQVSTYYLPN